MDVRGGELTNQCSYSTRRCKGSEETDEAFFLNQYVNGKRKLALAMTGLLILWGQSKHSNHFICICFLFKLNIFGDTTC